MNINWILQTNILASNNKLVSESSFYSSITTVFTFLFVFVIVIFLAFISTKLWAKKSQYFLKTKNVHVIDSINLGSNCKIIVTRILGSVYILAINNNNISVIDKLGEFDQIDIKQVEETEKINVVDYLKKALRKDNYGDFNPENMDRHNEKLSDIKLKVKKMKDKQNLFTLEDEDEYYE